MFVDLLELPMRLTENDEILDTRIDIFGDVFHPEAYNLEGRILPIKPFINKRYWKYKSVETIGNYTVERIFLTKEKLDMLDAWWDADTVAYPVQCKIFDMRDPVYGSTYRYVRGIQAILQDILENRSYEITAFRNLQMSLDRLNQSVYSVIVPGLDLDILAPSFTINERIRIPFCDPWVNGPTPVRILFANSGVRRSLWIGGTCTELQSMPFNTNSMDINANCIDRDWNTYNLFTYMAHLCVPTIEIEMKANPMKIETSFSTPYVPSPPYDKYTFTTYAVQSLANLAIAFTYSRLANSPWTRLKISKYWTEEITVVADMLVENTVRTIEVPLFYLDIPIFLLGTVGLY